MACHGVTSRFRQLGLGGLLVSYVLATATAAHALPVLESRILVPPAPTTSDFIVAEVRGLFPSTGFGLSQPPLVAGFGHLIEIDFFVAGPRPGQVTLPVILPFGVEAPIGPLPEGPYTDISTLFIDGRPLSALNDSFSVIRAPDVPLRGPSPIIVVAYGLVVLGVYSTCRKRAGLEMVPHECFIKGE